MNARVPSAAPTPRLPLYLYGKSPTRVGADGPALLVRSADKAPLRYPFARLARVIAGPRVEWQASALAACRREGLPIVFLDAVGAPTGYLLPVQGKPSRLDAVIEEILDRADWPLHYGNWLRARRMKLLLDWRRARRAAGRDIEEQDLLELIRRHVYRPEAERFAFPQQAVQAGALTAYALQTLHRAGLKPRYWGIDGKPLEVADDLARLLGLAMHLEMHGLGAMLHGNDAALLHVLHSFGARIEGLLAQTLGSLHRRLRTLLEEWR